MLDQWKIAAAEQELEDYLTERTSRSAEPEGYVPLTLDQNHLFVAFNDWLAGLRFVPGRLKKTAMLDEAQPMYVPVWLASGTAFASYRGQRGDDRKEKEEYTDAAGNAQTRETTTTDWTPVSGHVQHNFEDVIVCGWPGVPDAHVHVLKPTPDSHKPYVADALGTHKAQPCEIDARGAFGKARSLVEATVRTLVEQDVGGDHRRIESLQTHHANVSLRHVLMPVYRGKYRFRNKDYWVTVNAATGTAAGDYPISKTKILLAVLLGFAVVAALAIGLVMLFKK